MLTTFLANNFFHFYSKQPTTSPFDGVSDLEDLARTLTSATCDLEQWVTWKKEIKAFIQKYAEDEDKEKLHVFFQRLTRWGIERNPQKTMAILVEIVSLDILARIVSFKTKGSGHPFKNIFDYAAERALFYPAPSHSSLHTPIYSEWKKCRHLVLHFIPNLINKFLDAFNFFDSHKIYKTQWDHYVQLEIIYKFFLVPYCLIKVLQPVLVITAKVYVVAAVIIINSGILLSCYQRWLRPLPDELLNCTNLDKQMEKGLIEPKVGQIKELELLTAALEVERPVLLIGRSGEGKTALVHHLLQQKHLSNKLRNLAFHEVDCGLMISHVSHGYAELINQTKAQINGYDEKVLLFFDEFNEIATNKAAFKAFKKRFLENKPHPLFVATITSEEFQKIKKLDTDGSFRRRVVSIVLQSSDDQTRLVLREHIQRAASDISVTEEAIQALLQISAEKDYLPEIGRPAKAIKILMDAIGLCRISYNPHYVSVKLSEAQQKYEELKLQARHTIQVNSDILNQSRVVRTEMGRLKEELGKNKNQIAKIKRIFAHQQELMEEYYRLTHLFADHGKEEEGNILETKPASSKKMVSQTAQIMYLWYEFYAMGTIKEFLQTEMRQVNADIPIQVNAKLIRQVYQESKEVDKKVFDDMKKIDGQSGKQEEKS